MSSSQVNTQESVPSTAASSMYAASVNPPRKAKLQAAASLLPALLPSPPSSDSSSPSFSASNSVSIQEAVQPRKKRGRKPASGGSSRAAREAARKANHSRIEKARRGKINNALQELKRLVPPDFAPAREDEDEEDDDEDLGSSKKESGKKGSSEREFKLDILERTVLFVRALLKRVDESGEQGNSEGFGPVSTSCSCQCHSMSSNVQTSKKRKVTEREEKAHSKKPRTKAREVEEQQDQVSDMDDEDSETVSCADTDGDDDNDTTEDAEITSLPNEHANRIRLPSISELLSSPIEIGPPSRAHVQQLPSPSLSPETFARHSGSQNNSSSHFVSNLPSPLPLAVSLVSPENGPATLSQEVPNRAFDSRLSIASYPVGMSYLLTPPSPNTASNRTTHMHAHTPAFRLPSSALGIRGVSEERVASSAPVEAEADSEDGGARTATLALLQMRRSSTSYSRSGAQAQDSTAINKKKEKKEETTVETKAKVGSAVATRTSLTPGGLLGIQTGERAR